MERRKQEDELKQVMQQEEHLERMKVRVITVTARFMLGAWLYVYSVCIGFSYILL